MAMTKFREPNMVKWLGTRPAHNGEQIMGYKRTADGIGLLYTVPADKILLLFNYNAAISHRTTLLGNNRAYIKDTTPTEIFHFISSQVGAEVTFTATGHLYVPIEIPAGYKIEITSTQPDHFVTLSFQGILIDA